MATGSPVRMRLTKTQRQKLATLGQRYIKTSDPTANDDADAGYLVWDQWINQNADPKRSFICLDTSVGAAVWESYYAALDAGEY